MVLAWRQHPHPFLKKGRRVQVPPAKLEFFNNSIYKLFGWFVGCKGDQKGGCYYAISILTSKSPPLLCDDSGDLLSQVTWY